MSTSELTPVWNQIEWLHSCGVSLIPVRDKQQGDYLPKTPYRGWKEAQTTPLTLSDLWTQLDAHKTTAVAIICGKVSGNLEIIDIDVKYKPGIDAVVFMAIQSLYPDLYQRLRIHKTPSGGYHILYRTTQEVPGNKKLAGRFKTPEELTLQPKPKQVNFIESRGEGGYAVAPPSLNYTVLQDVPIPIITWEDRCAIDSICRAHSEITEIATPYKPTQSDNGYYDENPFDHFNGSEEGEQVLISGGWKAMAAKSNTFTWYTRPGKDSGVSASFNKAKRVYYIFTSSTEFDESKGYNPATVLSILQHGGDRKKTYAYLVQKGYGRIKPEVEARIVKNKASQGKPLPSNASTAAKTEYVAELVHIQTTYPYGIFWAPNPDSDGFVISRESLYQVADGLGYRVHGTDAVRISGYIISKQTDRQFFDGLKDYIKEDVPETYTAIANAFEAFIQKNGAFTITRLPYLREEAIVCDTSNSAYKFYTNGYLFITGQGVQFNTYHTLSGLIWADTILQRPFTAGPEEGRYVEFLNLATTYTDHIRKVIGYLAHQYKDETTGYIIVLTESCPDPKQGGGSGKNIFSSLLRHTTTYKAIPGTQVKYDEKFLQSWNREHIFSVSDVPKKFDFSFLKELSTGSGILKKLFKDEVAIEVNEMPKFIIGTNFSYEVTDGGLKRRLIVIEFTDFFTRCGGVDVHFNCHFPKGWTLQDWNGFDNFIAGCIKDWLSSGLKLSNPELTEGGWSKQFEQTWGQVITGIITDNLEQWVERNWISNDNFRADLENYYKENNTAHSYRPSMARIYYALGEYCRHNNLQFHNNLLHRNDLGMSVKHKWFGKAEESPF